MVINGLCTIGYLLLQPCVLLLSLVCSGYSFTNTACLFMYCATTTCVCISYLSTASIFLYYCVYA